jgi:hypothetical protein
MATGHPYMIPDLEVTLVGTRADLRTVYRALAALGTVTERGTLHPAERPDTGRVRLYLRVAVAADVTAPAPRRTRPAALAG